MNYSGDNGYISTVTGGAKIILDIHSRLNLYNMPDALFGELRVLNFKFSAPDSLVCHRDMIPTPKFFFLE